MYGSEPKLLGFMDMCCTEMLQYQYMPVKLAGQTEVNENHIEPRLHWLNPMIGKVCCDYVAGYGLNLFVDSYVYVTAKCRYVKPGCPINREGWHSDGFGTSDINYIWYDCLPTVFSCGDFSLSNDDRLSIIEMTEQAKLFNNVIYPNKHVLRLNQYNIHRVSKVPKTQLRTFVKVSVSLDKYDLEGNTKNYLLDYDWNMKKRDSNRNVPQSCVN